MPIKKSFQRPNPDIRPLHLFIRDLTTNETEVLKAILHAASEELLKNPKQAEQSTVFNPKFLIATIQKIHDYTTKSIQQ
jgi:hypothetical protein